MTALFVAAIILLGSLVGSSIALVGDLRRAAEARRQAEIDYNGVFGPAFNANRVKPVRVTYRAAEVREEMAKQAEKDRRIAA